MPRVVHFEIQADDPKRAEKFYRNVFGWSFKKWDGPMEYWMVDTGKDPAGAQMRGINGGLYKRPKPVKGDSVIAFICTIDVSDVSDYEKKVTKNGGAVVQKKSAIPGVGWFAQCKDTEGNMFGMMQPDMAAK